MGEGTETTAAPPRASSRTGLDQKVCPGAAFIWLARNCSFSFLRCGGNPPCMLGQLRITGPFQDSEVLLIQFHHLSYLFWSQTYISGDAHEEGEVWSGQLMSWDVQ